MTESMNREAVAKRLNVSDGFLERMIVKGRLVPDENGHFDPERVEELARLLERLRANGVAEVIGAIGEELGPTDSS